MVQAGPCLIGHFDEVFVSEETFDKAMESVSAEQKAFHRAVAAARMKRAIDLREQDMLESFPENERGAVLAFVRWCEGQKFKAGIRMKLAAKAAFIQGFKVAEAAYAPMEEIQGKT